MPQRLVNSETIVTNPVVKNMAFRLCVIGPGVSEMLTQTAPKETEIPILSKSNWARIKLGKTTPKVMRSPSPKYWLSTKFFTSLVIFFGEINFMGRVQIADRTPK